MSTTADVRRDLDRVLRPLEGHGLYRNNAFRVTGLPTDASSRQVRRHREETENPYYATSTPDGDLPLPPSDDADALRAAFEVLRDPVARLVHELFWLGPADVGRHDAGPAIFAHSRALEATGADGTVADAAAWTDWETSLRLWSKVLAAEHTWAWVRARAAEIDDPRLSVAVLRALRDRLPEHVIGVSVGLAVRSADVVPADAESHMAVLEEAMFEPRQVRDVARAAVEPAADRVRRACETARGVAPTAGLSAAAALLDETSTALATMAAVLGDDDDLVTACRDEVARGVNNCVLGYVNEYLESAPAALSAGSVLDLLREARTLASSSSVGTLLDNNIADLVSLGLRGGSRGRPRSGRGQGDPRRVVLLIAVFVLAGLASWWFVSLLGLGPAASVVGVLAGGAVATYVARRIFDASQDSR
ncbi:hypothetical protein [Promicromonospora sp. NPDC023987]|uniref:hypothetical protein n=1 Tax=Promicromonospora sp. NPDC023987 TaxID=3155360 RepID=UPI0033C0685A